MLTQSQTELECKAQMVTELETQASLQSEIISALKQERDDAKVKEAKSL